MNCVMGTSTGAQPNPFLSMCTSASCSMGLILHKLLWDVLHVGKYIFAVSRAGNSRNNFGCPETGGCRSGASNTEACVSRAIHRRPYRLVVEENVGSGTVVGQSTDGSTTGSSREILCQGRVAGTCQINECSATLRCAQIQQMCEIML